MQTVIESKQSQKCMQLLMFYGCKTPVTSHSLLYLFFLPDSHPHPIVCVQLLGPGILPHHCNLMHTEGMVTVTPHGPDADTFVDGQRVTETTVLRSGSTLQFGSAHVFKFVDPMFDQGGKREPAALMRGRHKSG